MNRCYSDVNYQIIDNSDVSHKISKHKCSYCGKEYEQNSAHINYSMKDKNLCSYTCYRRWWKSLTIEQRARYLKNHSGIYDKK